jgi:flavin-dependent dehydrogenase
MASPYDVIVIGARCAGSPTAMLLARKGYRVLVVDRATFPSDTMSTHFIHPPGVAALERWGLLEQVRASGCPPVTNYSFDFGPFKLSGSPRPFDGMAQAYGPRRTVLDKILVDAAAVAGAEVREKFIAQELVTDDGRVTGIRGHDAGGASVTEHATVVVGADGRYSMVAKTVEPEQYNEKPSLEGNYYTYWSNLPVAGFETFIRPQHGWATVPTNDGLTLVVAGVARALFDDYHHNVESTYLSLFDSAPEFAERIRGAKREARFAGTGDLPNYFRKPYGPGWALVGDAGFHKDPLTAFGITDAFHDVELLVDALDRSLTGERSFDDAMKDYQQRRDEAATPMFELTCQLAAMEPPPPEMQALLGAVNGNQEAMDDFASVMAGTLEPPAFFSPDNIGRIMAQAHTGAGAQN